jgi:hypothetical protein
MKASEPLIESIRAAFADYPYPGNDNLVDPHMLEIRDDDYLEVYKDFKGKNWQTLTSDFLEWHYASVHLLSPVAFVYYLPAFLISALVKPHESNIPDSLTFSLTPPDDESLTDSFDERMNLITKAQSSVIYHYIQEYMKIDEIRAEDSQKALEYWKLRSEAEA